MATPDPTPYCVCQQTDGAGIMIECIRGSGGCNGWVHPSCCGLILTQEELEALDAYVCPLCEKPDDDFNKLSACNTSLANRQAKRERKRKLQPQKPVKKPWICAACQHPNRDRRTRECEVCHARRVMEKKPEHDQLLDERRQSKRGANKKRKSYHVPNSDEDMDSDDSDLYKKKYKKHKKRRQEDSESDEAEFQLDTSKLKEMKPKEELVVPSTMVIDKIMGLRQREVEETPMDSTSDKLFANRPNKTTVAEYLIKWKGFAYMHASWETKQVLLELDPLTNKQKIKRFHEKEQHRLHHPHRQTGDLDEDSLAVDELEYFNPEYLEIHRIIAHRKDTPMPADPNFPDAPVDDGMRYYIKWRILSYEEATWERACDIKDDAALAKYKASIVVPDEEIWKVRPRPSIREYRKLENSPKFGEDQSLSLRAYQLEGLNWLLWNWYNERPSILADEMGLGKTIQTLSFLNLLRDDHKIRIRGPFLIVAPLSLIVQWQNECETWTTMNCVVYHGNSASREIIRDFEFNYLDENLRPDRKKPYRFNILVTTYEVAIKDIAVLSKIHWRCLVVDEAHRLKNQSSRLVEQMRSLRRDHCVLLTGTPLQNKTEELWALLNFLDGRSFPSVADFLEKFGDLHEAQQVADLHKMLKPYLLRRVKEDVEKSLPPKEETIVEVELTPVQKQWYRAIYE
ncbi:Chromodomain-helicase-DNA-binding protein, partial [Phytophthora palmivora]